MFKPAPMPRPSYSLPPKPTTYERLCVVLEYAAGAYDIFLTDMYRELDGEGDWEPLTSWQHAGKTPEEYCTHLSMFGEQILLDSPRGQELLTAAANNLRTIQQSLQAAPRPINYSRWVLILTQVLLLIGEYLILQRLAL